MATPMNIARWDGGRRLACAAALLLTACGLPDTWTASAVHPDGTPVATETDGQRGRVILQPDLFERLDTLGAMSLEGRGEAILEARDGDSWTKLGEEYLARVDGCVSRGDSAWAVPVVSGDWYREPEAVSTVPSQEFFGFVIPQPAFATSPDTLFVSFAVGIGERAPVDACRLEEGVGQRYILTSAATEQGRGVAVGLVSVGALLVVFGLGS